MSRGECACGMLFQMRALSVNGSPSRQGRTVAHLKKLELPVVHLSDGIEQAVSAILDADLVVFATPVYWFNVSALMKQLIEALPEAPDYECEGKIAFLLAVCDDDGGQQALNQMAAPLSHMGFGFPPYALSNYINHSMMERSEEQWQREVTSHMKSQIGKIMREHGKAKRRGVLKF